LKRLNPGIYPHAVEKQYEAALVARSRRVHREMMYALRTGSVRRVDAIDPRKMFDLTFSVSIGTDFLKSLLKKAAKKIDDGVRKNIGTGLDRIGNTVFAGQRNAAFQAQSASLALGILEEPASYAEWIDENIRLIKSIDERYFNDVREVISTGLQKGMTAEQLAKQVRLRFHVTESRAKLIARDQVGKFHARMDKERHEELGITRFIWSTSLDERVREDHRALEGKIFTYAQGHPTEGLPGQPIQCRCVAIPIIDEDDEYLNSQTGDWEFKMQGFPTSM